MARKRCSAEQIVNKMRKAEVPLVQGLKVPEVSRRLGLTELTYYRRVTALLRWDGWCVNQKRVERISKQQGLTLWKKQPKRGRLWLNDGSCVRLRPEHRDHV